MTTQELPEWWRSAVRDVQADYATVTQHLTKALDLLYGNETLVRGIGSEYGRRAGHLIRDANSLWVDVANLRHEIGEATP